MARVRCYQPHASRAQDVPYDSSEYYPHSRHHATHSYPPHDAYSKIRPRLLPVYPHHSPSHAAKAYEMSRPTNRYQPSRGAKRDAKYLQRTHLVSSRPRHHLPPSSYDLDRIRAEQHAAIARARQALAAQREEDEQKVRRVQLQVFVHARPTYCAWKGCHAVLNSWALLEKHLLHAHLYPAEGGAPSQKRCKWDGDGYGCGEVFSREREVYRHCLVGHMGRFSARCPFDCRFEGETFPALMAHIERRHPSATPDDFVPGLIHHRPPQLPRRPALPRLARVYPEHVQERVRPFPTARDGRVRRLVGRGCMSGRRPRKDDFEDKKGAVAAIAAVVENARRLEGGAEASDLKMGDGGEDGDVPMGAPTGTGTSRTEVQLVDVGRSAKDARDDAEREVGQGEGEAGAAGKRKHGAVNEGRRLIVRVGADTPEVPEVGLLSMESEQSTSPTVSSIPVVVELPVEVELKTGRNEGGGLVFGNKERDAVKRSERLRRKRRLSVSTSGTLVGIPVMESAFISSKGA